jgi:hypothetical protein
MKNSSLELLEIASPALASLLPIFFFTRSKRTLSLPRSPTRTLINKDPETTIKLTTIITLDYCQQGEKMLNPWK